MAMTAAVMGMGVLCAVVVQMLVGMGMGVTVLVGVGMLVGMGHAVMGVLMGMLVGMGMFVFMVVLQMNGVFHHQNRRDDHDGKSHKKLYAYRFAGQEETESHAQEGGDGIVGAGLGGT